MENSRLFLEIIRLLFPEKRLLLADSGLLTRDIILRCQFAVERFLD